MRNFFIFAAAITSALALVIVINVYLHGLDSTGERPTVNVLTGAVSQHYKIYGPEADYSNSEEDFQCVARNVHGSGLANEDLALYVEVMESFQGLELNDPHADSLFQGWIETVGEDSYDELFGLVFSPEGLTWGQTSTNQTLDSMTCNERLLHVMRGSSKGISS